MAAGNNLEKIIKIIIQYAEADPNFKSQYLKDITALKAAIETLGATDKATAEVQKKANQEITETVKTLTTALENEKKTVAELKKVVEDSRASETKAANEVIAKENELITVTEKRATSKKKTTQDESVLAERAIADLNKFLIAEEKREIQSQRLAAQRIKAEADTQKALAASIQSTERLTKAEEDAAKAALKRAEAEAKANQPLISPNASIIPRGKQYSDEDRQATKALISDLEKAKQIESERLRIGRDFANDQNNVRSIVASITTEVNRLVDRYNELKQKLSEIKTNNPNDPRITGLEQSLLNTEKVLQIQQGRLREYLAAIELFYNRQNELTNQRSSLLPNSIKKEEEAIQRRQAAAEKAAEFEKKSVLELLVLQDKYRLRLEEGGLSAKSRQATEANLASIDKQIVKQQALEDAEKRRNEIQNSGIAAAIKAAEARARGAEDEVRTIQRLINERSVLQSILEKGVDSRGAINSEQRRQIQSTIDVINAEIKASRESLDLGQRRAQSISDAQERINKVLNEGAKAAQQEAKNRALT